MSNPQPDDDRHVQEALRNLQRVDEQLNLAKDHIARASYHNRKAKSAVERIGGLPTVALSMGAFLLAGVLGWSVVRPKSMAPTLAPAVAPTSLTESFVGSRSTDRYHRPTCTHAGQISEENRIKFATAQEAQAAGFRPCKHCLPDAFPADAAPLK